MFEPEEIQTVFAQFRETFAFTPPELISMRIEELEQRILRLTDLRSSEKGVDWDIDANLPIYTRDYLRLINEGVLQDICTFGTVTH